VAERPYTVTEITQAIRQNLEAEFPVLWIVGEISQYNQAASGHRYFTLIDPNCQLRCVMWRSAAPAFRPETGVKVLARGRITVYERNGEYQLNVTQLFPAGSGQQQLALEALKRKLQEEGLFDQARKRSLPAFPLSVGVVTSRTGAAIRDILNVLERRFRGVNILLRPALVQGAGAPEDIALAIDELNAHGKVDVLIVGRGGGSAEDLAAFNTEIVVRAICGSNIPVISAVGHEIDVTLADLAADCRAPTPSAAAELAVRDASELRARIHNLARRSYVALNRYLKENEDVLDSYLGRYGLRKVEDNIFQNIQAVDDLHKGLQNSVRRIFDTHLESYRRRTGELGALSPLSVLSRGYSLTHRADNNELVTRAETLSEGEQVRIRLSEGEINCTVDRILARSRTNH
jgi:exodeoxyribonuclease VII large subunit